MQLETKTKNVLVDGDIVMTSSIWVLVIGNADGTTRTSEGVAVLWIIDEPA